MTTMKPSLLLLLLVAGLLAFPRPQALAEAEQLRCRHAEEFLRAADPDQAPSGRHYAPSREIDLLHVALDITPDWKQETISGVVTLRFKPISRPLPELALDAVDLTIEAVTASEPLRGHQATDRRLVVTFENPVPTDKEAMVTIRYRAKPERGLYFRTPESGYRASDTHLWTQGEPTETRHWIPCFDAPNEKFTSEITCRVPAGMTALSNGRLVSETKDDATGLVAVRWVQEKPHVTYLLCLVAGYLKKVEDTYRDIPLALYTPASQIDQASRTFQGTKQMMAFFEEEIGVPYPWAKYYQVCVEDYHWGGMENTSLTVLNDRTLHTAEFEQLRSSQGLVAHELAHQWFGDLVTCKDWSHLWLNEGFATYYEALYTRHKDGRDEFLHEMLNNARGVLGHGNQTNAMVRRNFENPEQQFSYLAYPKGSWILHMLRSQLGEALFRRCIKTYVERHQYGNVTTQDLQEVIEELSGRSFDQFFDQYVHHASHPELGISYSWDERHRLAKISVAQNQKVSRDVLLFEVPLTVRFKCGDQTIDRELVIREKTADFHVPLPSAPTVVRIDPELTLLAKIDFTPSTAMLHAQLADAADMIGRLLACEQLGQKKDTGSIDRLKATLNSDPFYAVRLAAASALRAIDTDAAYEALAASTTQPDARVRQRVVGLVTGFFRESSYETAVKVLKNELNPDIRVTALQSLGAYPRPETRSQLLAALESRTYRHVLADAAVATLRATDDPANIEPLLAALKRDEDKFTVAAFGRGLEALGFLARNEEKKDGIRDYLLGHLDHRKRKVQLSAMAALGLLGDTRALPALEKIAQGARETPSRTAAAKAVSDLRANRKPGAELGKLRDEVLSLQKENRDLRKDLDDLKKKFDSLPAQPETGKAGKKGRKGKSETAKESK